MAAASRSRPRRRLDGAGSPPLPYRDRMVRSLAAIGAAVLIGCSGVAAPQGVFVFGGYLAGGAATARAFRFDASAGRWDEIAPMPGPRAAAAAVASGGSIFIVGGADGSRLIAPTYEYDVIARAWRTVAAIPTPRDHLAAVGADGTVC